MTGLVAASASFSTATARRGNVRVAEAEVDHVAALAPKLALQLVDRRKDVGRKIVDSPELHVRQCEEVLPCRLRFSAAASARATIRPLANGVCVRCFGPLEPVYDWDALASDGHA